MTHPGQILKQANLYAGKELGQNFLSDSGLAKALIKRTGISKNTRVLEIGPGLGALTIPIARAASEVIAVEKDRRLISLLEKELASKNLAHVRIIHNDILKQDIRTLAGDKKLIVIGNLPYNISSQILFKLVEERISIEKAFLMFQKELAQRIPATPGSKRYSRLSAVVQYAARVDHFADVGPACFFPRPEVESTILEFNFFPPAEFTPDQEKVLFRVIKAAFSKRRKTLKNSLSGNELGLDKSQVYQLLEDAGIDAVRRAETLNVEEFKKIAGLVLSPDKGYSL